MNKHLLTTLLLGACLGAAAATAQTALKSHPAYLPIDELLDLKNAQPEVNVNLPKFLLAEAAAGLDDSTANPLKEQGIQLKELIKDIQLIRVVVLEGDQAGHPRVAEGLKKLRAQLESDWISIVQVPEGGVGVYALADYTGSAMQGLAVLVHDGGEAVLVNVVGGVPLAKIISLATSMDKFPKELLKNFSMAGAPPAEDSTGDESAQ